MLKLDACWRAACKLAVGEQPTPSLTLALWSATLSCNSNLVRNCRQVRVLRPYVARKDLPQDWQGVKDIIASGDTYISLPKSGQVCAIQAAVKSGRLDCLLDMPGSDSLEDWRAWRDVAYSRTRGLGLGYKTLSFAALLLWPTSSQLVPVDRHVCARFGIEGADVKRTMARKYLYTAAEDDVRQEWEDAGSPYTLAVWHWYKWEQWRQAHGDAPVCNVPQSHAWLNCYAW